MLMRLLDRWLDLPTRDRQLRGTGVRPATERYLLYFLLPAWLVPGLLDHLWHRRTRIEETSGTRESLIHALMMTEVGVPVLLGLVFEVNATVLAMMIGNAVVHEATAIWDVRTALQGGREVRQAEQHTHSLLEMLPVTAASFMVCLHWGQFLALVGLGGERPDWRLRWKRPRLGAGYLGAILGAIALCVALPYGEELLRCRRAERRRDARRTAP
jgi:hypothetical protein